GRAPARGGRAMADGVEIQGLARSLHELLLLAALREGPRHGYQIALEVEERSRGFFTFNHGTLYPILHHLEKEGLIDGAWEAGEGRRRRKEYSLSAAGRERLRRRSGEWGALWTHLTDFLGEEPLRARAASDRP